MNMLKITKYLTLTLAIALTLVSGLKAAEEQGITEISPTALQAQEAHAKLFNPLNYSLGPDDVVEITVMNHPEFSGIYPINKEGKLQYKFVGDIDVNNMTKKQLEDKITEVVSRYVVSPSVNVTVTEYQSKFFYVMGAVASPGKYVMRAENITVREAVLMAGLPTGAAALRKCRIISPVKKGRIKTRTVDLYAVLYAGKLRYNYEMKAGDILYVPQTIMAKIFSVISPVTSTVSGTTAPVTDSTAARAAVLAL